MYVVSLNDVNRIIDVFDPAVWLDPGVQTYPISDDKFQQVWESGRHCDWLYDFQIGDVVYDPIPDPVPENTPQGSIPVEVL